MKTRSLYFFVIFSLVTSMLVPFQSVSAVSGYIQIDSAEELVAINENPYENYILTKDIDLSGYSNWTPISCFYGVLDGDGHKISNMKITEANDKSYLGLFGVMEGVVKNLSLDGSVDVDVTMSTPFIAAIAPYSEGQVINCDVNCDFHIIGDTMIISLISKNSVGCKYNGKVVVNEKVSSEDIDSTDTVRIYNKFSEKSEINAKIDVSLTDSYSNISILDDAGDSVYRGYIDSCSKRRNSSVTVCGENRMRIESFGGKVAYAGISGGINMGDIDCRTEGKERYGEMMYADRAVVDIFNAEYNYGDVNVYAKHTYAAIYGGNNSGNLVADGYYAYVYGSHKDKTINKGDIVAVGEAYAWATGTNGYYCRNYGDIIAKSEEDTVAYGNYQSRYSVNYGDVTAKSEQDEVAKGNAESSFCVNKGKLKAETLYGNYDSDNSINIGSLNGRNVTGNEASNRCYQEGNIRATERADGSCYNSFCVGDIYSDSGQAYGGYGKGTVSGRICIEEFRCISHYDDEEGCYKSKTFGPFEFVMTAPNDEESDDEHYAYYHYYKDKYGEDVECGHYESEMSGYITEDVEIPDIDFPDAFKEEPVDEPDMYYIRFINELTDEPFCYADVILDSETYITDETGRIVLEREESLFDTIHLTDKDGIVYSKENVYIPKNRLHIIGLGIDEIDFDFGAGGETVIYGPDVTIGGKTNPLFELPYSLELSAFNKIKLAYDKDLKEYQVLMGNVDSFESNGNNKISLKEAPDADQMWKEAYNAAVDALDSGNVDAVEIVSKKIGGKVYPHMMQLGVEAKTDWLGYLRFKANGGEVEITDGKLMFISRAKARYSAPFAIAPYLYYCFSIEGRVNGELGFTLTDTNDSRVVKPDGSIEFMLTPGMGLGAGLDRVLSAEVGVQGELSSKTHFPVADNATLMDNTVVTATLDMYFQLTILMFQYRFKDSLVNELLYPRQDSISLMSVDENDMIPIQRSDYTGLALMSNNAGHFQKFVYPYGDVKVEKLSDGRILMVWLDDDITRSETNKTALYYSIETDGVWSEPKQVENDKTADFEFDIKAFGNNVYVVWQDAKEVFDDNVTVDNVAKRIELSYSVFDGSAFSKVMQITNNEFYEYSPQLYAGIEEDNFRCSVAWKRNPSDDAGGLHIPEGEKIYISNLEKDGWSKETEADIWNEGYITEFILRDNDIWYILDYDGDTSTTDDMELYCNYSSYCGDGEPLSNITVTDNKTVFVNSNGNLQVVEGDVADFKNVYINGKTEVVYNSENDEYTALFEVQNELDSELYMTVFDSDVYEWSLPVRVTQFDKKIRSWDVYTDENGELKIAAMLTDIQFSQDNFTDVTFLVADSVAKVTDDIAITDAVYDEVTGAFYVTVLNNSDIDIDSMSVAVADNHGNIICEQNVNADIEKHSEDSFIMEFDDGKSREVVVSVSSDAVKEEDLTNNVATVFVDNENLKLNAWAIDESTIGITVINCGQNEAHDIRFRLTSPDDDSVVTEGVIETLQGNGQYKTSIQLPDKYVDFKSYTDNREFYAEISCTDDPDYDNNAVVVVGLDKPILLMPEAYIVSLREGEVSNLEFSTYPVNILNETVFVISENENIAVYENSKIKAVDGGETLLHCYVGDEAHAIIKVLVEDTDNLLIDLTSKTASDLTVCFKNKALQQQELQGIVALYDTDGRLIEVVLKKLVLGEEMEDTQIFELSSSHDKYKYKILAWSENFEPLCDGICGVYSEQ